MTNAHRDLATPELWNRSLDRSRRRRALLPKARRENNRRKHLSAALATAVVAGPGAPIAAAQVSGDVSAAVAAESPANRAIEIREGGLPLRVGSQGDLVAHVQTKLGVASDGVFGPQTDAAVRKYQLSANLDVDGIVGPNTWSSLFAEAGASGASLGGSNVPPQVQEKVEQTLQQAGTELAVQGDTGAGTTVGGEVNAAPPSSTTPTTPAHVRGSGRRLVQLGHDLDARQGHGHVSVRAARRTQPRRHGHRRAHGHTGPRGCLRDGQHGRAAERLRQHRVRHAHQPVLDVLRAPVALRRVERGAGPAGPGDRLRGLHRQLHRAAPALRDSRERAGAEPEHLPVGWLDDPGQAGERGRREQRRHAVQRDGHNRHDAAGQRRDRAGGTDGGG